MSSPLDRLPLTNVRCSNCGTKGMGNCDCWEWCTCGWYALKGNPCGNPATTRCSSKLKALKRGAVS